MNNLEEDVWFFSAYESQIGPPAQTWLKALNLAIHTQGMSVDSAKELLLNRDVLNTPDPIRKQIRDVLATHYGLPFENTVPSIFGLLSEIDHERDLSYAVDYERFDVNPLTAIQEYRTTNWIEALTPYSTSPPKHSIGFATFADACRAAVVHQKAKELVTFAENERDRILTMTPKEWKTYAHGIRWSQEANATDVYREWKHVADEVFKTTKFVDGLFFKSEEARGKVLEYFSQFPTSQQLAENSKLVDISPNDFIFNRPILDRNRLLIPNKPTTEES